MFKNSHPECEEKRNRGLQQMTNTVRESVLGNVDLNTLEDKLSEIAKSSYINPSHIKEKMILGWGETVDHFLEDGNLDEQEENKLTTFMNHFSLTFQDLDKQGACTNSITFSRCH